MSHQLILYVVLSLFASALNYIIYPLIGRILPTSDYTDVTVALSLFTQISVFFSSIVAVTIGLSKVHDSDEIAVKIEALQRYLLKIFMYLLIVFFLLSPMFMKAANIPLIFAVPLSIMLILSIPVSTISGYLNGKKQLIKLGIVLGLISTIQFTLAVLTAMFTSSGIATMMAFSLAQLISTFVIYAIYSAEKLPNPFRDLKLQKTLDDLKTKKIIAYSIWVAGALTVLSIMQIADLLIVRKLVNVDIRMYTDIYTISRIVFFVGTIFIWPFLGKVSIKSHKENSKSIISLLAVIVTITVVSISIMYFTGDKILNIIFGSNLSLNSVREITLNSILFKGLMLVVLSEVLYFVVHLKKLAVQISIISTIPFLFIGFWISKDMQILPALQILNYTAICVIVFTLLVIYLSNNRHLKSLRSNKL